MGCRNSDTPGEAGCARYYLNAQWIELLVKAADRWPSRKLSRVNTQPFHSCDQRGSFEAHAGLSVRVRTTARSTRFSSSRTFSWPMPARQLAQGGGGNGFNGLLHPTSILLREVRHEQR